MGKKTKMRAEKTEEHIVAQSESIALERKVWRRVRKKASASSKPVKINFKPAIIAQLEE